MASDKLTAGVLCVFFLLILAAPAGALDVATPYVQADFMWNQGYTGVGVEIGIIDLFLADNNHPAIAGNYLGSEKFVKGGAWYSSHATSVIGAAVSQDPTFRGPAFNAGWWTGQTTKRSSMTTLRTQTVAAETFGQGLRSLNGNPVEVLTFSIGVAGSSDGMDQWSLGLDHIVNTNGRTITLAVGNDGPAGDSITGRPTGAYNVITVGATGNFSEDYTRVADFSSRGPTDDGRSKPDIVAPGSMIHLPVLNSNWSDGDGTSFATPLVAGGAGLLIGMGQDLGYATDPKVIKSVLLNSADKLDGWSHTSTQPLDYAQGAGQMNLRDAYSQYVSGQLDPGTVPGVGWDLQEVTDSQENLYFLDMLVPAGEMLTATLAWDRIVSTDTEDIESVTYSFDHLDNLDLYLYDIDDLNNPIAASISTVDNVEHIYFSIPETGRYAIGVKMAGAVFGDLETYGLAWHLTTNVLFGDADLDGFVDDDDLSLLLANWHLSGDWSQGNFSGDSIIDDDDLSLLLANWGATLPPMSGIPVPEPGILSLLAAGAHLVLLRRKRR